METEKRKKKKTQKQPVPGSGSVDRVTFSESVRVNIGDYEHREAFCSVSLNQRDDEALDDAFKRARNFVNGKLKKFEKKTRFASKDHVDFDTMAKLK